MTNNDYLSQEEIDALLRQSSEDSASEPSAADIESNLSMLEQDALGEIGNITFGNAATALSTLLGKKIDITTPKVSIIERHKLTDEFPKPHVAVHVTYVDGFQGINSLIIKTKDAQVIADLMLGGEGIAREEELNEIHISAVQEAMNQMMGSSATSMSTIFNRFVNISPPAIDILDLAEGRGVSNLPEEDMFVKISFRLTVEDLIDSTIMQLLPVPFAKEMVQILMGGSSETESAAASAAPLSSGPAVQSVPEPSLHHQAQPPYGASVSDPMQPPLPGGSGRNVNVQPVQFTSFPAGEAHGVGETNLDLLLDIPLKVTVELGRTKKQIKEILELSQGSIIELDKLAGEPVDILVNNKPIAKGEVVVIDENFGVRVTDILSPFDRFQKIQ